MSRLDLIVPRVAFLVTAFEDNFCIIRYLLRVSYLFDREIDRFHAVMNVGVEAIRVAIKDVQRNNSGVISHFRTYLYILHTASRMGDCNYLIRFLQPSFQCVSVTMYEARVVDEPC